MGRKKALLAGAIFVSSILAYNCGGGGGGTASTGMTTLDVYATDAPPQNLTSFEVKVYTIALCNDIECNTVEPIFYNPEGSQINLTDLDGTLLYLDTSNVPSGTYPAVKVEIDKNATAVINGETKSYTINCKSENAEGNCEFKIPINLDITQSGKLILDFNLSQATFENSTVENFEVKPLNPDQVRTRKYKYKIYAELISVNNTGEITFSWRGETYTAKVGNTSACEIEINDQEDYLIGNECIDQLINLPAGTCMKLKLSGDPSQTTPTVLELETKESNKCLKGYEENFDQGKESNAHKGEMSVDLSGFVKEEDGNWMITLDNMKCSVRQNVHCEIDDDEEEDKPMVGDSCLSYLENIANSDLTNMRVKVKYRVKGDGSCEVYKIDIDEWNNNDENEDHNKDSNSKENPGDNDRIDNHNGDNSGNNTDNNENHERNPEISS